MLREVIKVATNTRVMGFWGIYIIWVNWGKREMFGMKVVGRVYSRPFRSLRFFLPSKYGFPFLLIRAPGFNAVLRILTSLVTFVLPV